MMGKMAQIALQAPAEGQNTHVSWASESAQRLHPAVRYKLIVEEQTEFDKFEILTHTHIHTNEQLQYHKITTYKLSSVRRRRPKVFYACLGPQHVCTTVSVYNNHDDFVNHMSYQHKPHITCPNCSTLITPPKYKSHYEACLRASTSLTKTVNARKQQNEDIQLENDILMDEMNDKDQQFDVIKAEDQLIDELEDRYQPIQRNKRAGICAYSTPLLRIETLQYLDISIPERDDLTDNVQYLEWTPHSCDKADNCNIVQHGTFVRFCYDSNEPFLIEIKRYRCTKHFTINKKSNKRADITFNMLSECVNKQMNERLTVRKSHDVHVFDSVLITASLWTTIASNTLITLNDSHVNTMIKHTYRRHWQRKQQLHMDHKHAADPQHICTASECYGLTLHKADEWVTLYQALAQRALDISTTRALYQRHIVPTAVLPRHNQLQHKIITECCSNAISMDHTFKMAKFGLYNEIIKDTRTVAAVNQSSDSVMNTSEPQPAIAPNQTGAKLGKRKRYNQSVIFTKLNAQLLTVMDSNGYALCSYVVPGGKTTYQLRCLYNLLKLQYDTNQSIRINTVSVDNASQVGQSFKALYKELVANDLTVLQDLYHARERIEREFVFGHLRKMQAALQALSVQESSELTS